MGGVFFIKERNRTVNARYRLRTTVVIGNFLFL